MTECLGKGCSLLASPSSKLTTISLEFLRNIYIKWGQIGHQLRIGRFDAGVKAIVIACNTASAAMLRDARERYQIPVIEVIQPAVRRAVSATRSGKVGVIGTNATIDSKAYLDAFAAAPQLSITSKACPLFVEYVESGRTSGDEITKVAQDYLNPMKSAQIDTLVLGCTHYPLLTGVISR